MESPSPKGSLQSPETIVARFTIAVFKAFSLALGFRPGPRSFERRGRGGSFKLHLDTLQPAERCRTPCLAKTRRLALNQLSWARCPGQYEARAHPGSGDARSRVSAR